MESRIIAYGLNEWKLKEIVGLIKKNDPLLNSYEMGGINKCFNFVF